MITTKEFKEYCKKNNLRYEFEFEDSKYKWSNESLFIVLCKYGYIETIKWLYSLVNINIHSNDEEAFIESYSNEKIDIKENGKIINIHINNEEAFRLSCYHGHLEVAKWLMEISKENGETINIHIKNEEAFRLSCSYGHLEVVKWLMEISKENGEMINIHIGNEDAFRSSCINGKIEVAKWLIKISIENGEMINIHASNDDAFKLCCYIGYIKVAKWLCNLCDDYYIEIEDNKIVKYVIRKIYDGYLDENKGIKKIIKRLQLKVI